MSVRMFCYLDDAVSICLHLIVCLIVHCIGAIFKLLCGCVWLWVSVDWLAIVVVTDPFWG